MKFKENETTELKKSLAELKEGLISISAILNKHGAGSLWFGISHLGKILGLDVSDKTLRDVSQSIAAHIEPKIYPHITKETIENRDCIKVTFSGKEFPYFAYGKVYMRVADEDRQLTAKELENLILIKNRDTFRWDNEPCKMSFEEIDEDKVKRFIEKAGLVWDTKHNALEKLGLLKNEQIVNASQFFFAKHPKLQLRCAVFSDTTSAIIIDRHDFDGDILELIEEAQKYILKNIYIGMRLKGLYREDISEISPEAIREAIINAFCHRNYRDPDYIHIAVFKDRVEIRSPGGLYGGLTIEDIRKGNISKRRNPLIADLLRRIHMVEAWGRGMPLILKNAPDAEFQEVANTFITVFSRPSYKKEEKKTTGKKIGKTTGKKIGKTTGKKVGKTTGKKVGKTTGKIAGTAEGLLAYLRVKPKATIPEMASLLHITIEGVNYHLRKLKKSGLLKRVGGRKAGYWKV